MSPAHETGESYAAARVVAEYLRDAVIARDGYVCGICRGEVEPVDVHIDHVVAYSKGGPTALDNLRVTHSVCNVRKGAS